MGVVLKFRHQKFQEDASRSVCEVFTGQRYHELPGISILDHEAQFRFETSIVWGNHEIEISDNDILANIQRVQNDNGLEKSQTLEGKYNLTIEMETGTGKTYTYIRTIYELNRLYGWSKFIIIVPSIAIREGVHKTFEITEEHFTADYGRRAYYFVYNSGEIAKINGFVSDSGISVMIINSQAFNAKGKDARRIRMELDQFASRKPLDVIAASRPVMIIDEPQSVEGAKTRESLKDFNPLFTLRYSATPRENYNMIYKLDAVDAYNRRLVKRIRVTGISLGNVSAQDSYIFLKGIIRTEHDPLALIEYDTRTSSGIKRVTRRVREGFDLFEASGGLEEYKQGCIIRTIDGLNGTIEFLNGKVIECGEVSGSGNEEDIRRIQIRETIEAHLEKERQLYSRGIKVLSLFFIDEVGKYRRYDDDQAINGIYARIFEEEYADAVKNFQLEISGENYAGYLGSIEPSRTHAGYFSIDKHNHMTNSKVSRKEDISDDVSAFDLIMRDKERLLSLDEPVRFIFSHSALREGWDNPNVFQICTLRNSSSDIRRRQEVGRGLRLCVNQDGERIEEEGINELNIIASESYREFAAGLQQEISEASGRMPAITDARNRGIRIRLNRQRLASPEFMAMWSKINHHSVWRVSLDDEELVRKSAHALNESLNVPHIVANIEKGIMNDGVTFEAESTRTLRLEAENNSVRYDIAGRLSGLTGLTRRIIINILKRIDPVKFKMLKVNPEVFIVRAGEIINGVKSSSASEHVSYEALTETYGTDIFTDTITRERPADTLAPTPTRGLYDYAVCDSKNEKRFANELDICADINVFTKLPASFTVATPAGKYNPDWAIVFRDRLCFVAETKGSASELELRAVESAKVRCAREHFRAVGDAGYEVVSELAELIGIAR